MNKTQFEPLDHLISRHLQRSWSESRSAQVLKRLPGLESGLNPLVSFLKSHGDKCYDQTDPRY
ncbi:hypothetical protein K9N68_36445 (plasmid) [Kovacikia minuta CCNUW1]|uniref:hypothetical protein n=1 Tax=Kovacikia minuta TaxID=2931930 RepID=UPI001CCC0094|nr:hypothetical protein [Kovacikia minuta]UBF30658.1 hypothetical protein K9N68_36445 [Kovacikia minuta CCNUW1]